MIRVCGVANASRRHGADAARKGVVREVRNNGRLLIEVGGRSLVFEERAVTPVDGRTRSTAKRRSPLLTEGEPAVPALHAAVDVDLHGLTVEEALARAEQALNDALLADASELRVIHGKGGGRIRVALHRRLREIPTVRAFRIDPQNAGVTIVSL